MFDILKTPERISNKIKGLEWTCDNVGKSHSKVMIFEKMVLKIEKITCSSKQEIELLDWLDGKLPVPKIIEAETQDDYSFLLMTKLPGEMACTGSSLKNMEDTVIALVNGLKTIWQVNIANCPYQNTISEKLIQTKYNIENNFFDIDINNFEHETLCADVFLDIRALYSYLNLSQPNENEKFLNAHYLYDYLNNNRPKEDLVFSHGDFSFPNIFVVGNEITGIIDWGCGGIADRWEDISECYRVLRKKYSKYGIFSKSEYQKYENLFFRELGYEPDEEKIRYFILLREFF